MLKIRDELSVCRLSGRSVYCTEKFINITIFLICILLFSVVAYAKETGNIKPDELVSKLKEGGYIIYLRHAATDHSQRDIDLSDLSRCDLQRNLSEQGISESQILGKAIKKLGIKVEGIYTSPYCRCVDTANIAFERYEVIQDMRATFATNIEETKHLVEFLRSQLSVIPKQGYNTILVGHTANLREVTEVWPKPEGVAHIFMPLGKSGYRHMGKIEPGLWGGLAGIVE